MGLVVQHCNLVPIHWMVCLPGMLCQCRGGCLSGLHCPPVLTQPLVETSVRLPLGNAIVWSLQKVSECCVGMEVETSWTASSDGVPQLWGSHWRLGPARGVLFLYPCLASRSWWILLWCVVFWQLRSYGPGGVGMKIQVPISMWKFPVDWCR